MWLRSIFISLWLTVKLAYAAPGLSLWQAWELALANDPIYAAQRAQSQADQEPINQARAHLLPTLEASAGLEHTSTRRASTLAHASHQSPNQWQLRLSQPLIDLAALSRLDRSRYLAAAAVLSQENAKNELMLRVAHAYFEVLSTQDTLQALKAQQQSVEHQLQAAQRSFELGGATITDSLESKARLDLIRAQRVQLEKDVLDKQNQLSRIIAQPVFELQTLGPQVQLSAPQPAVLDQWLEQARYNNLTVHQQQLQAQAQQQQLQAQKREHAPTVHLQARSGSQSNTGIYGPNQGPRALDNRIGIELSIPLYKGGEISSKVRESASLLQRSYYEAENARRQAKESVQLHFNGVHSGLLEVHALEAAERSSAESVQANQKAYEIGVRINLDVLDAQQQLYQTQRDLAHARYTTLLHGLQLKQAAGQLQESDLQQLSQLLDD